VGIGVPAEKDWVVLPAQRSASAVTIAMALCPSDRLSVSVIGRSSVETDERIELVFGTGASFLPS